MFAYVNAVSSVAMVIFPLRGSAIAWSRSCPTSEREIASMAAPTNGQVLCEQSGHLRKEWRLEFGLHPPPKSEPFRAPLAVPPFFLAPFDKVNAR